MLVVSLVRELAWARSVVVVRMMRLLRWTGCLSLIVVVVGLAFGVGLAVSGRLLSKAAPATGYSSVPSPAVSCHPLGVAPSGGALRRVYGPGGC